MRSKFNGFYEVRFYLCHPVKFYKTKKLISEEFSGNADHILRLPLQAGYPSPNSSLASLSIYWVGVKEVSFLKALLKVTLLLNPTS